MDDKEIEKILGEPLDIKDQRSKEDVLARLKKDDRLRNVPNTKKKSYWIPVFIGLASVFLLGLLLPSMFKGPEHKDSVTSSSTADYDADQPEIAVEREAYSAKNGAAEADSGSESRLLFAEEIGDAEAFQMGLVSNATTIPITFLIPYEQIQEDFPQIEPNAVQLYERYAAEIREEALGFDEYHPYKGEFVVEGHSLVHKLPENHGYDLASAAIEVYMNSMKETFRDYDELEVLDAQNQPITFNQVGRIESVKLAKDPHYVSYYQYVMASGASYFVPFWGGAEYATVEEALLGMKEVNGELLLPVVPSDLLYDVRVEGNTVFIAFSSPLDLLEMKEQEAGLIIEGMILTATQGDYLVQFENILQTNWGKYDFTSVIAKPVAVNHLEW